MNLIELQEALSSPDSVASRPFEVARSLCALLNENPTSNTIQELILRALEVREHFGETVAILDALVRSVGLYPYLTPEHLPISDALAYEFHRPLNLDGELVFHRIQADVYRELLDGRNVILSAPTSFGKSLIIDAIVALKRFKNIVIVVPTIALIDETRRRLSKFRDHYKVISHVSQERKEWNILILTQERVVEYPDLEDVDFFVVDEFYKLHPDMDADRSQTLNHALYRLLKKGRQFYMLGPNIRSIPDGFENAFRCTFIHTDYATVVSEMHRLPKTDDREGQLVNLCKGLSDPTLIYCASPTRANAVVRRLVDAGVGGRVADLEGAVSWLQSRYHPDWQLLKGLAQGIGLHHGRVPRSIAEYMVRAFNRDDLRFLVCTSTLIEGVNTKAKNVIVYDNKVARSKLDYFTFNNIRGRSGRMFQHFVGRIYLFDEPPQEELPYVDVPMFTQNGSAADSLLVQIQDADLGQSARSRVVELGEQSWLPLDIVRESIGVEPRAQMELAKEIEQNAEVYIDALSWSGYPTYDQLKVACELIWKYFAEGRHRSAGVTTASQLAYKINRLRIDKDISVLIRSEMNNGRSGADDAVERVLFFLRNWASFHFPKYLACLDRVQRAVFGRRGWKSGDYSVFVGEVENWFFDPTVLALEEYGIPVQVTQGIADVLRPDGDLDGVLERLKRLVVDDLEVEEFERELLQDAQNFL